MLKAEGLVDADNNPDLVTLGDYGDALGFEMPAGELTNEQKLQVLVDNAGKIRDAVVALANSCSGSGSGSGAGAESGSGAA